MKQRRHAPADHKAPPGGPTASPEDEDLAELENSAAQAKLARKREQDPGDGEPPKDKGTRSGPPTAPSSPAAPAGPPGDLPHRAEMEAAFGEDFGDLGVTLGLAALQGDGAHAATDGEHVAFASPNPDTETVAHELAHVVADRRSADAAPPAPTSSPGDASETEARAVGRRVAAGQSAGPITAPPSAAVHRDAATPEPKTTDHTLMGRTWTVVPDSLLSFPGIAQMPNVLGASTYRAMVDSLAMVLYTRLVAALDRPLVDRVLDRAPSVDEIVAGAEPEVRTATFELIAEAGLGLDVSDAHKLAAALDPLAKLEQVLASGKDDDETVGAIQGWAAAFGPDQCTRALADGDIQVGLNRELGSKSVLARMYLIGAGTLDQSARGKMLVALYQGNSIVFLAAWAELKATDGQLAYQYLGDASFLDDVRDFVKDAYPTVTDDVAHFQPAPEPVKDAKPEPMTADELNTAGRRADLEAAARPLALAIATSIRATGGTDTWFGDEASQADPAFTSAAGQVYAYRRSAVARASVDPTTEGGRAGALQVDKEALEVLVALLPLAELRDYGTAGGRAPFFAAIETADYELGKRLMRDTGQADLSPEELAPLQAAADLTAARLAALKDSPDAEAQAAALVRSFGDAVRQDVQGSSADPKVQWATREKRRKAQGLLDRAFEARTHQKLRDFLDDLAGWMGTTGVVELYDRQRTASDIVDPDAYADALTALDHKHLDPIFAEYGARIGKAVDRAGKSLRLGEDLPDGLQAQMYGYDNLTARLKRSWVSDQLASLRRAVRNAVAPQNHDGKTLAAWDRKVRAAMDAFDADFAKHHRSLRKALDDGVGDDEDKRGAQAALGQVADPTEAARQELLEGVKGDATRAHDFLESFGKEVDAIAADLASELKPAMQKLEELPSWGSFGRIDPASLMRARVDDDDVLASTAKFAALRAKYVQQVPGGTPADATKLFTAAFAPLGGDVRPAIARGLDEDAASRALSQLGLRYKALGGNDAVEVLLARAASMMGAAPQQEDFGSFADRLQGRALRLSRALASISGEPGSRERDRAVQSVVRQADDLVAVARLDEGWQPKVQRLWSERVGIELAADLGTHLAGAERGQIGALFGVEPTGRPGGLSAWDALQRVQEQTRANQADPYAFLTKYGVSPGQVDPAFDLDAAQQRAMKLNALAGRLPGSRNEMIALMQGGTRTISRPAEMKVVLGIFSELYGYDLRYRLDQAYADDPDKAAELDEQAQRGGVMGPAQVLLGYARTGSGKEVVRQVLRMSAGERGAVLQDFAVLGEIRRDIGEDDYDQLYKALSGKITLYDVIRRDEDVGEQIEEYFEGRRRTLAEDDDLKTQAGGDPQKLELLIEAKLKAEGRAAFSDPAVAAQLEDRDGDRGNFEIRARLLGGGKLTTEDEATKAVEGDGTDEDALVAATGKLSAADRARLQSDPFFQRRIASDLQEKDNDIRTSRQVFGQLYGTPGENGLSQLEGAWDQSARVIGGGEHLDRDKAMEAVLDLSQEEVEALKKDPVQLNRLRGQLSDDEREELDTYLGAVRKVERNPALKGEKDKRAAFLVARYAARFEAFAESTKKTFATAQACFAEKGLVTDPKTDKQVPSFGDEQRREVWRQVEDTLKEEAKPEVLEAVRGALLRGEDPTGARLSFAFEGDDNQKEILAAIDAAGVQKVIAWSNVLQPGPTEGYGSLKAKLDAYTAARNRLDDALKADAAAGRSSLDTGKLEQDFQAARNRYLDHRLDMNAATMDWFSEGGGDVVKAQMWQGVTVIEAAPDRPSNKRLLEMKGHLRAKILALTAEQVAPKVGFVEPEPPGKTGDAPKDLAAKERYEREQKEYEAKKEELISEDRLARSGFDQRADVYAHERGEGHGHGAEEEGQGVDVSYQSYHSALGQGLEDSTLSKDEVERIKAAGGDFDRKVQEYKEAKARLGGILKMIMKAVIVAVATALTGGALGPLATLLVAGAGAMSDNVIDSIVNGNDFDWEEDGVSHVLSEVGGAALTLGMSKAFEAALPALGLAGKYQKVMQFEEKLATNAKSSFSGMMLDYGYQSGKSVVMSPLATIEESAIDLVKPSEWKYGAGDYTEFTKETFTEHFEAMSDELKEELVANLGTSLLAYAGTRWKGALGKGKGKGPVLPGMARVEVEAPEHRGIVAAMGHYLKTEALKESLDHLTEEGLKLLVKKVSAEGEEGEWSEEDVIDVLVSLGVTHIGGLGKAVGESKRHFAVEDRIEQTHAKEKLDEEQLEAYRHHLETAGMGPGHGALGQDPEAFKTAWEAKKKALEASVEGKPHADAYVKWVMADPARSDARTKLGYDEFAGPYQKGLDKKEAIEKSETWGKLTPVERSWYEASVSDPQSIRGLSRGPSALDVSTEDGVAAFRAVLHNTVVQRIEEHTEPLTAKWPEDERAAFAKHLEELDAKQIAQFEPEDEAGTEKRAHAVAADFAKTWKPRAPAPEDA